MTGTENQWRVALLALATHSTSVHIPTNISHDLLTLTSEVEHAIELSNKPDIAT